MTHRHHTDRSQIQQLWPKLAIEARFRLGWQVGVGARLTDNTNIFEYQKLRIKYFINYYMNKNWLFIVKLQMSILIFCCFLFTVYFSEGLCCLCLIQGSVSLKVVLYLRLSSSEGCLLLKVVFHLSSSSMEGHLLLMVVFLRRCLPSKVV